MVEFTPDPSKESLEKQKLDGLARDFMEVCATVKGSDGIKGWRKLIEIWETTWSKVPESDKKARLSFDMFLQDALHPSESLDFPLTLDAATERAGGLIPREDIAPLYEALAAERKKRGLTP